MIKKQFDVCCTKMISILNEQKTPLYYTPHLREYNIPLEYSPAIQGILFCPWCGTQLPKRLRDEFFSILNNEYNIEPAWKKLKTKGLPQEFKTDEWWKKRGL